MNERIEETPQPIAPPGVSLTSELAKLREVMLALIEVTQESHRELSEKIDRLSSDLHNSAVNERDSQFVVG